MQAADGPKAVPGGWKQKLLLAIPTIFDLIATVLMNIGLLHVTASVYQMMRGAEMLFAALFSVVFLKRNLNLYHYLGILCCVVRAIILKPTRHEIRPPLELTFLKPAFNNVPPRVCMQTCRDLLGTEAVLCWS